MVLKELIMSVCNIPAVPMVSYKVLRLIEDPPSTSEDMHQTVTADQAVAIRIIKIANSAFYCMHYNINTLMDSITIIGFNILKYILIAVYPREVRK